MQHLRLALYFPSIWNYVLFSSAIVFTCLLFEVIILTSVNHEISGVKDVTQCLDAPHVFLVWRSCSPPRLHSRKPPRC
jgi:hypothetical protein